ncbi:radical SAM protein [Streptomyces sp. CBMA152]|uniref:radical SAM protein n=1 Tax=Streptomyces sp. CBMA152 TaxID=1896312 RepID=UPI0016606540|nr:radical SAM protein [Streptomyces sp. CBMA152]MBD0741643.1 radical SAM/SPASM domain-containing protein [Streptomyces sp. CBMA152]
MPNSTASTPAAEALYAPLEATGPDTAVSVILKLRGETCNIDCLYCYEKRKEAPGGARIDADQVHRLGQLFADRPVCVELHGGEPLTVGRERMAEILDALAAQPNVIKVSIQTNGLLLDDAWLDLFNAHYPDLQFGISLDGDGLGNSWRVDYDGQPTHPRVVEALRLLGRRNRQTGIICAVTPYVLARAGEVIDHLAGFEAVTTISLVPCFDTAVTTPTRSTSVRGLPSRELQRQAVGPNGPAWAITPAQYADFVLKAAAHWITSGTFRTVKLEPIVSVIRRLKGLQTTSCHFSELKCSHVFTLYPDDRIGSCDELPWPEAKLSTLPEVAGEPGLVDAQRRLPLLQQSRTLVAACVACDYRDTCSAGCLAVRLRFAEAGDDDAYCAHRMRLIDGVATLLAQPEHPAGMWCTRWRWRPRHPNSMHDVAAFLGRWDDPAAPRPPARLRLSPHGNINTLGLPGIHEADDLDPRHPQWHKGIEPRVRPVVDALTQNWSAITYDSCGGHAYDDLPNTEPRFLGIGILPRTRIEYARLAARLCHAAALTESAMPPSCVLQLRRGELSCRTTGQTHPVLDLQLTPAPGSGSAAYFRDLDQAAQRLAEVLTATEASPSARCPCAQAQAGQEDAA